MDNEAITQIYEWLAKDMKQSDDRKLLRVVLRNPKVQELVKEYWNTTNEKDSKEGWSLLREMVMDRVQLMKEGIAELQSDVEDALQSKNLASDKPDFDGHDEGKEIVKAFYDVFFFVNSPKSTAMLHATSGYFEWLANQHPEVVQLREEVLGRKVLALDEAHKLLRSYAARFLPFERFLDWGISVVGHSSEIIGEYDWGLPHKNGIDHRVTIRVDPPGITKRVRYADLDVPVSGEETLIPCVLQDEEAIPPYSATLTSEDDHEVPGSSLIKNIGPTVMSGFHTPNRPLYVWPGSVVDRIYKLSDKLADTFRWPGRSAAFPAQRKDAAAEFVLTGKAPLMCPLEARLYKVDGRPSSQWQVELRISPWVPAEEVLQACLRMQDEIVEVQEGQLSPNLKARQYRVDGYPSSQRRIELRIAPWVSAKEVSQTYRRMQEQVLGGGRNRLPEPKTLDVGSFVREQERLNEYRRPKWEVLLQEWNKKHPEDRFKHYSHLYTYFKRADKAVKELNFDWP